MASDCSDAESNVPLTVAVAGRLTDVVADAFPLREKDCEREVELQERCVSVEVCGSDLLFDCITVALVVNVAEPLTDVE